MSTFTATRPADPTDAASADLVRSGSTTKRKVAAQAGFFPLPLAATPLGALQDIAVYLRTLAKNDAPNPFTLYSSDKTRFQESHRERLQRMGVRYIYLPMVNHAQFRKQLEAHLDSVVDDPKIAISTKAEMVYETSVEIIDELLSDGDIETKMPRLKTVAKAVTTLAVGDGAAFPHLFAASQHDFYTATHMVNVGTWMVALAYALGERDPQQLSTVCLAGMVHDVGKIFVAEEILNKRERLNDDDWLALKSHPARGADHLRSVKDLPDVALRVTLEHHERLNGTGYPMGIEGDKMHPMSKLCAVVDSFDAMTALRPFKTSTCSFPDAIRILRSEAGSKYDPDMVEAWANLMRQVDPACTDAPPEAPSDRFGRRAHQRFSVECPAKLHLLSHASDKWIQGPAINANLHNISAGGLGLLSPADLPLASYVRVHLLGQGTLRNKTLDAQIVRSRQYKDGFKELGLRKVSLDDELAAANAAAKATPAQP
ncbi:MAG TPA: HD domain-containing phosphohydrolase [Phycisphaerae bacterium]|nr:HD domain-containing phosphohydrolase [Phycisphaerae bacterium]